MNVDVIVGLVLVAGGVCGVWLLEFQGHRAHDLHARVARRDVGAQSVEHGEVDHRVQGEQAEAGADDPTDDEAERRSIHGRSIQHGCTCPGFVHLPPGVPSITERLDRWT